jgi:hypothetical protein
MYLKIGPVLSRVEQGLLDLEKEVGRLRAEWTIRAILINRQMYSDALIDSIDVKMTNPGLRGLICDRG